MDCARPICERLVGGPCDALARRFGLLLSLEENAPLLTQEMAELRDQRDALKRKVDRAKSQRQVPLPCVLSWLERVDALDKEAAGIEPRLDAVATNPLQSHCSPFRLWSGFQLGKVVAETLRSAAELRTERAGLRTVAIERARDPFADLGLESRSCIWCGGAFSSALEELRGCLFAEEGASVVAVLGPWGVGKTTLLRHLYYQLVEGETGTGWDFGTVILVVMPNKGNPLPDIQKQVMKQLGLWWQAREDFNSRASKVREVLQHRKSVVLLDGVSVPINLYGLGIPHPGPASSCKVVIASRDEQVCDAMGASARSKVEMQPLTQDDAWSLFQGIVVDNQHALESHDPEMSRLAKTISDGCGGLPLALVVMGHHLVSKMTAGDWRQAADAMVKGRSADACGTDQGKLLTCMEFVLQDATTRLCFSYCSLFPPGCHIRRERLVEYWIGEGFLDECDGVNEARKRGSAIVRSLVSARLLHGCGGEDRVVRMNGAQCEFPWKTTSEHGGRNNVTVLAYNGILEKAPSVEDWREADRVILLDLGLPEGSPGPAKVECPHMLTLLKLGEERVKVTHRHSLVSLPSLLVLDLSSSRLARVPAWAFDSTNLRYLSLSGTRVEELPKEMGGMVNLRVLDLSHTLHLGDVPASVISRLAKLQVLHIHGTNYRAWNTNDTTSQGDEDDDQVSFQDLAALQQLGELSLILWSDYTLQRFLSVKSLLGITTSIELSTCGDPSVVHLLAATKNIRRLEVGHQSNFAEWTIGADITGEQVTGTEGDVFSLEDLRLSFLYRLETLRFAGGRRFRSLSSVCISFAPLEHLAGVEHLPCLEWLGLFDCSRLKVLVGGSGTDEAAVREEQDKGTSTSDDDDDDDAVTKEEEGICVNDNALFPRLKSLVLYDLSLKRISKRALTFPCLESLRVHDCHSLTRLPLAPDSAMNIREIAGSTEWWDQLKWVDETTKTAFSSSFVEIDESFE